METLYQEGKIKAIGVCNFLQFQLEDLMGSANILPMVNQVEFHPYLVQQSLIDFCEFNHIQFESWFPLMHGEAVKIPFFIKMAGKYQRTIAQLLLRWNLQKGAVIIPKSINRNRIEENARLFDFIITNEDVAALDALDRNFRMGPILQILIFRIDNWQWFGHHPPDETIIFSHFISP